MRLSIYGGTARRKWCWREVVDGCVVTHIVNVNGPREWGAWGVKLFCWIAVSACKSAGLSFRLWLPLQDICDMEIGAGVTRAGGRAPDALEAIIRRLRASAARPPPPLRCALARTPNNPCYREALEAVCAARPGILTAIRNSPLQALAQGRQNHDGTESCRERKTGGAVLDDSVR